MSILLLINCSYIYISEIVAVGEVGDVEELASILGCGVALLPIKYLGLPLGVKV
jgi:hypothetical protein